MKSIPVGLIVLCVCMPSMMTSSHAKEPSAKVESQQRRQNSKCGSTAAFQRESEQHPYVWQKQKEYIEHLLCLGQPQQALMIARKTPRLSYVPLAQRNDLLAKTLAYNGTSVSEILAVLQESDEASPLNQSQDPNVRLSALYYQIGSYYMQAYHTTLTNHRTLLQLAKQAFEKSRTITAPNTALDYLSLILFKLGEQEKALEYWILYKSLEQGAKPVSLDHRKALEQEFIGDYSEEYDIRKKAYQTAIDLNPSLWSVYPKLSQLYAQQGQWEQAYEQQLNFLVQEQSLPPAELKTHQINAYYEVHYTLEAEGKWQELRDLYERLEMLSPRSSKGDLDHDSFALLQLHELEKVERMYREYYQDLLPKSSDSDTYVRAFAYQNIGDLYLDTEAAQVYYQRADAVIQNSTLTPEQKDWRWLQAYFDLRKKSEMGLAFSFKPSIYFQNLASHFVKVGDWDKALKMQYQVQRNTKDRSPDKPLTSIESSWAQIQLGELLQKHHENGRAVEAYQKALEIDETDRRSDKLYLLAQAYWDLKQEKNAIRVLQELRTFDPEYVPTYYGLGTLFLHAGHHQKAIEIFQLGLQYSKNNSILKLSLSEAQKALAQQ